MNTEIQLSDNSKASGHTSRQHSGSHRLRTMIRGARQPESLTSDE